MRNIAAMGDPRNWTARKAEAVRRENAAADREQLVEVTFYSHGRANMVAMHPCDTFRFVADEADARCHGCGRVERLNKHAVLAGRGAHLPWPTVMAAIVCTHCGSRPSEVRFVRGYDFVAAVSVHPTLSYWGPVNSEQHRAQIESVGTPDPEAQHDDGDLA